MAHYIDLLRLRTEAECKRDRRSPTLQGEWAYKERTGMIAKVLGGPRLVRESQDFSEGDAYRYTVRVPNYLTLKEVRQLLSATYTRQAGCGHSYDCCGCSTTYIRGVRRIRRGQFSFRMEVSYNY